MYVLCSRQVAIFSVCSHPWKPQYARFSVTTFIVITGCFSFCILAGLMARKKTQKDLVRRAFYFYIFFRYKRYTSWKMGNTELFAELLKVSQITLCLVNQTLCSSGNLLFYCNSKALYKHLANRFNLSSCQKHVQSKKNNATGSNNFWLL